ncbi:MAG: thioredoxin domain-containing protein [Patescibacteria group bacterium]|jgi:mycoredoxin|nr:thioredoxin domain-containing protein [Patescibacteria group bacterium]
MSNITLYGANWCPDCKRSRTLLDSLKIKYDYIDIDTDKVAADTLVKLNNGMKKIPTIIFSDNSKIVEPSDQDLVAKLKEEKIYK